jgi:hypothetical protein
LEPGANLSAIKSYYVVHQPTDTHRIHELIRDRLIKDELSVTAGPELTPGNYKADSMITYVDRWALGNHAVSLRTHSDPKRRDKRLSIGRGQLIPYILRTRKSPEEMVDEVMTNIFNAAKSTTRPGTP